MAVGGGISLPTIRQRIVVDDSDLDRAPRRFGRLGSALGTAVAGGAATAAVAVGAFVAKGVSGAKDLETGLAEVVTLTGETGAAAVDLRNQFGEALRGVSDDLGIAQQDLVGGLYDAISAGIPADNVFEFMRVAGRASIAGVTDVGTAVDGLSTTINAFGLDASQAEAVADSMFAAVQGGKTTFEELSSNLGQVAPLAAAAGVSFEEVNAAVATLTSAGGSTAERMTQIKAALTALQRPSKEMTAIFNAAGYESGQAALEAEGLGGALQIVADAADGDNGKLQQLLGSVEAVGAAQVLAGTGAEKFAAEMDRQAQSAGSSSDAFEVMEDTTGRALERLSVQFSNIATVIGAQLLPPLARAAEWLGERLPGAIDFVKGVISDLKPVFQTVAAAVSAVWDTVSGIFASFRGESGTIGETAGAVAGHISGIIDTIRGFVDFVVGVVQQFVERFREGTGGVGGAAETLRGIMEQVGEVIRGVWEVIATVVDVAVSFIMDLWERFGQHLIDHVVTAWNIIVETVSGALEFVQGIIDTVMGVLTGDWSRAWEGIKGILSGAWRVIKGIVRAAINVVSTIIGAAMAVISALWSRIWSGIKGVAAAVWNAIVARVRGALSSLRQRVSAGMTAVRNFFTRAWNLIVSGIRYAAGRIVAGVARMVTSVIRRGVSLFNWFRSLPRRILRAVGNVGRLLYQAGRNIISGLINGIRSRISAVTSTISSVASRIRDFLPFSPAKEGPLSGRGSPDRAGATISDMLAEGMDSRRRRVAAASARLAGVVESGLPTTPEEALGALAGAQRVALDRLAASAAVGAGVSQTNHFDVQAFDPAAAARELGRQQAYAVRLLPAGR